MSQVYVLHENRTWVEPLWAAFDQLGVPYDELFLDEGWVPFDREPPRGVFYNRMSASSHTRGHRFGPELTHAYLNWLDAYGRRVINDRRALYLEVSKVAQYAALRRAGVTTPRTLAAVGRDQIRKAARELGSAPFILKPNRGGKGLGVQLIEEPGQLDAFLDTLTEDAAIDGTWLVQEYIRSPDGFITRCEFVGGRFLYAVRVDTQEGFELCPADPCMEGQVCPAAAPANKFRIIPDPGQRELLSRYETFLAANGIEVAGIEFIVSESGDVYTYDVNTNTNYNSRAEAEAQVEVTGMEAIARFLGQQLGVVAKAA